jgi:hypothetical protein
MENKTGSLGRFIAVHYFDKKASTLKRIQVQKQKNKNQKVIKNPKQSSESEFSTSNDFSFLFDDPLEDIEFLSSIEEDFFPENLLGDSTLDPLSLKKEEIDFLFENKK